MDRLLYIAMSGAKETLRAQAANNHNLANVSTTGFRADMSAFQSRAVEGSGYNSRVYATDSTTGWNDSSGALISTGNPLDVAVHGEGWIAVQARDGTEAYTRAGDMHVDPSGMLMNAAGHPVLGDGGPITIPPSAAMNVAPDGSISIVPQGQGPETTAIVGRIKLVKPPRDQMIRGEDGLFRVADGSTPEADASVKLATGSLETSNVNVADAMVQMIELARRFDLQVKSMRSAEDNGAASSQLLRLT
jgi:flagellar basal-body rod protein FlgF